MMATLDDLHQVADSATQVTLAPLEQALLLFLLQYARELLNDEDDKDALDALIDSTWSVLS